MKLIQKIQPFVLVLLVSAPLAAGCSGSSSPGTGNTAGVQSGGAGAGGTTVSPGGTTSAGGQIGTGGISIPTAGDTGGSISSGGDTLAGGAGASGGDTVAGGSLAGGTTVSGGNTVIGGSTSVLGGTTKAGGSVAPAGTTAVGGTKAGGTTTASGGVVTGGTTTASGGVVTGGTTGGGGVTILPPVTGRVRTIMPLDRSWLFNKGDAAGADGATFADSAWKPVTLPHDWAIEGPFASSNPTTGRGGYAPSGIAWYRNHFTLPTTVAAGQQVYIEFDGVMRNSTVSVNGTQAGTHPYGYVSFRYDITKSIKFGAENVVAVKTDTSSQPSSRYYEGGGIYRRARIIATDPVHIDQWATYVTTPSPTATSATVKVTTTVVNSGTTSQSVGVQGTVSDATGTALPAVAAPAQTIAAGASANFAFDVTVPNPKLWSLETPNMYQLVTVVQVGGKAVDDDVTPFGIRSLVYDAATGLNINGKNVKMKGVCLHQDYHGLGLGAPARAMQKRIAALKGIGANAVRTAHDPPSPDFLDLCDRMGVLVMDEFFDIWAAKKYQDSGDFSVYFNKASSAPTGVPAVPGGAAGASWYQVDVTGVVSRDRNHPSISLYSAGNEIRDSISTRTPILTKIVGICHALDPGRAVTQALFQPNDNGDVTGATRTLLDVFGGNYRTAEVITAMGMDPKRAGVITEKGPDTATWTGDVMGNAGLTGDFIWTGVDYLGEQDGGWPSIGGNGGLLDSLGVARSTGVQWAGVWGGTVKSVPASGAQAGKVVLTADHAQILNDVSDVSFVKAAVPSDVAVTFSITGPGTIIAVDSSNSTDPAFRGTSRTASGGLAYAIVRATGAGSITVTATASGLTAGTATITATDGTWVPCSGTCD
jgi:beta-galactosidase